MIKKVLYETDTIFQKVLDKDTFIPKVPCTKESYEEDTFILKVPDEKDSY